MARIKGTKNNMRSPKEKEQIILEHLEQNVTRWEICQKYHLSPGTICTWLKKYEKNGLAGLESQTGKKSGPGKGRKRKNNY